jgi:hypothetical protein
MLNDMKHTKRVNPTGVGGEEGRGGREKEKTQMGPGGIQTVKISHRCFQVDWS